MTWHFDISEGDVYDHTGVVVGSADDYESAMDVMESEFESAVSENDVSRALSIAKDAMFEDVVIGSPVQQ